MCVATCMECGCTVIRALCCGGPALGSGRHGGGLRHEGSGSSPPSERLEVAVPVVALYQSRSDLHVDLLHAQTKAVHALNPLFFFGEAVGAGEGARAWTGQGTAVAPVQLGAAGDTLGQLVAKATNRMSETKLVSAGQLLVQAAMLKLPRACLTMKHTAAISMMHIAVQDQIQRQLKETLQVKAKLEAQFQKWTSLEATRRAQAEAMKSLTLGELTDACEWHSWVLCIMN